MRRRLGRLCVPVVTALLTAMAAATPAAAAAAPAAKVIAQTTWGTAGPEFVTADAAAPDGGFYETGTTNLADSLGDPLDLDEIFLIKVAANGSRWSGSRTTRPRKWASTTPTTWPSPRTARST